jgi:1,4-alpha-glucan branching enzyme
MIRPVVESSAAAVQSQGEQWMFRVYEPRADHVYLVKDYEDGPSSWVPMNRAERGWWELTLTLMPGRYRVRYFIAEGSTFYNCGGFGLVAQRAQPRDSQVVEPVRQMHAMSV